MLAKPLTDLTQKDKAFSWGSAEANVFTSLKSCFTTAPILAYPDNDCQFRLETDALDFMTGAVLSILKDDKWHPVTFSSHTMCYSPFSLSFHLTFHSYALPTYLER